MLHFVVKTLVNYSVLQALRPEQVVAVHIDNGFMRKNESQEVEESLKRLGLRLKGNLVYIAGRCHDQCAGPQVERSGFKTCPGHCIVFLGTQEHKWVQEIVREA